MRLSAAFAIIFVAFLTSCFAQDVVSAWYPLQPGNSWTYQNELLSGYMLNPDFERWTTEETVLSAVPDQALSGVLVTRRITTISEHVLSTHAVSNAKVETRDEQLVIRQNCVYALNWPTSRAELRRGELSADYCFPLAKGATWGQRPNNDPDFVWRVVGFNDDPFGLPGGRTFRLRTRAGSGTIVDRWFEQGVGLLQEVEEHHGTYDEHRIQIVKSTINRKTQTYQLKPARTVGFDECDGPDWQHFVRENGTSFASEADCRAYNRTRH
jgi:hypothetical protein